MDGGHPPDLPALPRRFWLNSLCVRPMSMFVGENGTKKSNHDGRVDSTKNGLESPIRERLALASAPNDPPHSVSDLLGVLDRFARPHWAVGNLRG